jgi:hypothetical protein
MTEVRDRVVQSSEYGFQDPITNLQYYIVEKVVQTRLCDTNKGFITEYFIKWQGYPDTENTWEPERNLEGARETLQQYYRNQIQSRVK